MKFKVEVEIDWVDEDKKIDDAVYSEVKKEISKQLVEKLNPQLVEKMAIEVNSLLDEKVSETYKNFLDRTFDALDDYGNVIKKDVNVEKMLKAKFDKFLTENVDEMLDPKSYGGKPRWEAILDKKHQQQVKEFMSGLSSTIIDGIKKDINLDAQNRISKAILSDYSLKDLIVK